jgi:hypothetical protein
VEQESKTCGKEVDPADWYMGRQKKKIVKGGRRRKAGV